MTETITRTMIEQREAAVLTGHRALTSGQLHAATVKSYPARGAVRLVHARLTRWRSPGTTIAIMGRLRTSYIRPTRGMPSVRGGGSAGTGFASDHVPYGALEYQRIIAAVAAPTHQCRRRR